jgi:hypothetical protein
MKLPNGVNRVFAGSFPRRLSIACAAVSLALGGCSTDEAGIPKTAVNFQGQPTSPTENHGRSLEQVIQDQRNWYQMNE